MEKCAKCKKEKGDNIEFIPSEPLGLISFYMCRPCYEEMVSVYPLSCRGCSEALTWGVDSVSGLRKASCCGRLYTADLSKGIVSIDKSDTKVVVGSPLKTGELVKEKVVHVVGCPCGYRDRLPEGTCSDIITYRCPSCKRESPVPDIRKETIGIDMAKEGEDRSVMVTLPSSGETISVTKKEVVEGPPKQNPKAVGLPTPFRKELEDLINKHGKEKGSNTPDFILAVYLDDVLRLFDKTVLFREEWYGYRNEPGHAPQRIIRPGEPESVSRVREALRHLHAVAKITKGVKEDTVRLQKDEEESVIEHGLRMNHPLTEKEAEELSEDLAWKMTYGPEAKLPEEE